ncbi:hypothetical protein DNTS_006586 [Danionella cerebrum]|uniref:Breast carcinoma-amplified sequence 1 n=1 Tax=Danionella cerebrum TaxID=2873325 RepID=A0A553RB74_9TELE|nr:hypothetical protein DNTS_006586 [Danionella translucida]
MAHLNPEKGEELNGHAVLNPDSAEPDHNKEEPVAEKTESPAVSVKNDPKQLEELVVDSSDTSGPKCLEVSGQKTTITPAAEPPKTASKPSTDEVSSFFGKVFKKKPVQQASETSDAVDAPVVVDLKIDMEPDPVEIKNHTEAELEAQALQDVTEEKKPAEEQKTAEKSVMNFFKTLASPAKTSKEAQVTADASKEQEAPKAPPPPPPPAPPKLEGKAEPVLKKEETPAAKEPAKTKDKSKSSGFSKLFRSKVLPGKAAPKVEMISANGGQVETSGVPVKVEEKKPVEVKAEPVEVEGEKPEVNAEPVEVEEKKPEVNAEVDASKTSTLEAGASAPKAEEPPAPEEKKPEKKSTFGKLFKPKATVAKKETAASTPAPAAAAEAAPPAKPKEDPKAAAAAPSAAQPAPDSKSETSTNGASPNIPRKMEKRNSLQLFFKNLGPKRQSDGGAQPDAPAAATEKAK